MDIFKSEGVEIAYQATGLGPPVLLIHGFASNGRVNWQDTGWVKTLVEAGHTAIAIDNRGHGASGKLYDPAAYTIAAMAGDSLRLLNHLELKSVAVIGYSMGARIACYLALNHPSRISRAVLGGVGDNLFTGLKGGEEIARGLEAPSLSVVTQTAPRAFRLFAEQTRSDTRALAACMRAPRLVMTEMELARMAVPILVVAGDHDTIAGPMDRLLAAIPGAKGVVLEGRNHMNAVGDKEFKRAVVEFLE
jgi:pimeloyl-ACP methyl ester carboxylesterase